MSPTFAELYESDQEPFRALAIEFLEAKAIVGFYVPAGHDHRFGLMASIKFMRDGDDDNNIAHSEWYLGLGVGKLIPFSNDSRSGIKLVLNGEMEKKQIEEAIEDGYAGCCGKKTTVKLKGNF